MEHVELLLLENSVEYYRAEMLCNHNKVLEYEMKIVRHRDGFRDYNFEHNFEHHLQRLNEQLEKYKVDLSYSATYYRNAKEKLKNYKSL